MSAPDDSKVEVPEDEPFVPINDSRKDYGSIARPNKKHQEKENETWKVSQLSVSWILS